MKLGIMQPYFLPYIGYFQLIAAVDHYIIYDTAQYSKNGWCNRNRLLEKKQAAYFSLPIKSAALNSSIGQREIATLYRADKLIKRIEENYRKAPFFEENIQLISSIITFEERQLLPYLAHSLSMICDHLDIATPKRLASSYHFDNLKPAQEKVLELCKLTSANHYINAIGGQSLYQHKDFSDAGVKLSFLQPTIQSYTQFGSDFIAGLSILDVLMFNGKAKTSRMVHKSPILLNQTITDD